MTFSHWLQQSTKRVPRGLILSNLKVCSSRVGIDIGVLGRVLRVPVGIYIYTYVYVLVFWLRRDCRTDKQRNRKKRPDRNHKRPMCIGSGCPNRGQRGGYQGYCKKCATRSCSHRQLAWHFRPSAFFVRRSRSFEGGN